MRCIPSQWDTAKVQGKIIVTQRDANLNCTRAQRAIRGQECGAAAVIMVNFADALPEFMGAISQAPGTGEPIKVTTPLLGVRFSVSEALLRADGKTLDVIKDVLANPGYGDLVSFSSAGPRSGDVTAPGASISSALSGSGA